MILRKLHIEKEYLHFPVRPQGEKRVSLQLWLGSMLLRDCYLALSEEKDCSYFFLNVSALKGQTLTLIIPDEKGLTVSALNGIINGDAPVPGNLLYPGLYQEPLRPRFHFSSRRGWLNDPNGLIYVDGVYHLYYQHNPLGTPHGGVNISWGHAVSKDLLHWQEKEDAILPWRRDWSVASGSAMLDTCNDAGYGENAIIAAFTALGTYNEIPGRNYASGGQFLAASMDGGDSFHLLSTQAVVPTCGGEGWRDPCLFRYEDHYVMAVYETEEGRNCISFYVSDNLKHWERTSRNMDLFECPDLFELATADGERRWVLFGADGRARLGQFDGYVFTESGDANLLDYGKTTYASQTWRNHPEGKRIHIGWIFGMDGWTPENSFPGMAFSQCMSVPCELSLQKIQDTFRVLRTPIPALRELRAPEYTKGSMVLNGVCEFALDGPADYELIFDLNAPLYLYAGTHEICYDPTSRCLHFDNGETAVLVQEQLTLRILIDITTMELFFGEGISAAYSMHPTARSFRLAGEGSVSFCKWMLRSVWPE